jgi:hypothetical protein
MTDIVPFPLATPPAERERWYEMLKIAPLVIILLYMRTRDPQPVTKNELAENFLIDRKTAGKYMNRLAARDLVASLDHNNGYILTDGANQLLAGWGKSGHLSLKESLKIKDLKTHEKKEGKKGMSTFWTSAKELSVSQILEQTPLLFQGRSVMAFGLEERDPLMVLAVLAHAYDQQGNGLTNPVVFAYRRLQRNQEPDRKYLTDPEPYLPNDFLAALGLQELKIIDVVEEEPEEEPEPIPDAVMDAWEQVRGMVDQNYPTKRGGIRAYMTVAKPLTFADGVLVLKVLSDKAYSWLKENAIDLLQTYFEHVGQPVHVRFVSTETEG